MINKLGLLFLLCVTAVTGYAQSVDNLFGQTIQISTRFDDFVGKPIWTLIIRDIDSNQNIPYVFDIREGKNQWIAFTFGKRYLITASRMEIETYRSRSNRYKTYRINNFCNLESNGRIIKGESYAVSIDGYLSPNSDNYSCHVTRFPEANFSVYTPPEDKQ